MIFDSIINFFLNLGIFFIDLFPTVSVFGDNDVSSSGLVSVLSGVACIVPVSTLLIALSAWLVLANFAWLYAVVSWIYKKIPGVN